MSSVAEKNREAYNKKVKQSVEKTKKIKEKLANLKKKADQNKKMKEMGVKMADSMPTNYRDKIERVSMQLKDENSKAQNIKQDIKKAIKAEKYKIKSGDTLSKIARDRGITVAQIMAANPQIKDKNKIFAGKSISIPTAKVRAVSKTPSTPTKKPIIVTLKSGKKGTAAERLAEIDRDKKNKSAMEFVQSVAKKSLAKRKLSVGGDLKAVPTGSKGAGLSKLPTPVRNKMGFMYGGGMPMPSKKPRVSTTDYRKAAKGMLVISINMMKKKKGKGKKKT